MSTYATVEDYLLRTSGTCTVTAESAARLTAALDDASDLFAAYLGQREAAAVEAHAGVLLALVVARVQRGQGRSPGVRSETVGPYSVTYTDSILEPAEIDVLNRLTGDRSRLTSVAYTYD